MVSGLKKCPKKIIALTILFPSVVCANSLPVEIVNNTKIADDKAVYVVVKATDPATNKPCLVRFDKDGKGMCEVVTPQTQFSDYSYSLASLPSSGSNHLISLPKVASGRMYFSVGSPMEMYIDTSNPGNLAIIDPDGFKPRDQNYYTLYDKIEFSYNNSGVWVNPTAVDFFSLPIGIQLPGSTSGFKQAGLLTSREAIFNQIHAVFNADDKTPKKIWNNLFANYKDDQGGQTVLRLMATGKAMITNVADTTPFDSRYLSNQKDYGFNYIDFLWSYYQNNTLTVDCSELRGNPAAPKLADYIFTGSVKDNVFKFNNQAGEYPILMKKPAESMPFFAGAGLLDPGFENNNTPGAIIVREMTSAVIAGLLPANNVTLDKTFFIKNKGSYFTRNPLLPVPAGQIPWYDLYSKALHSFGSSEPIYAFAYDDALGQDGTLYDPNSTTPSTLTVTLGDMTGTQIPKPWEDLNTYSVTVGIGSKSVVKYIVDPKDRSKDILLVSGQRLPKVTIPFNVDMNGEVIAIYIKHPMVKPFYRDTDGVVISHAEGSSEATIAFPGRAAVK